MEILKYQEGRNEYNLHKKAKCTCFSFTNRNSINVLLEVVKYNGQFEPIIIIRWQSSVGKYYFLPTDDCQRIFNYGGKISYFHFPLTIVVACPIKNKFLWSINKGFSLSFPKFVSNKNYLCPNLDYYCSLFFQYKCSPHNLNLVRNLLR